MKKIFEETYEEIREAAAYFDALDYGYYKIAATAHKTRQSKRGSPKAIVLRKPSWLQRLLDRIF